MTKTRAPLTFPQAIIRVADVVGFPMMAQLCGRADRSVRYWSEDDCETAPTLVQAKALDLAYQAAGGAGFPILESYALQLETDMAVVLADHAALAADIAAVAIENADAIAHSIAVTRPGASPTEVHRAIAETEEASGAVTRLLGRLKSFLTRNGAGLGEGGYQP